MSTNREYQERKIAAVPRGIKDTCPFYIAKARNAEIWDVEGKRYIDFAGGIGVLNVGHRHPKVEAAIADQLGKFTHTAFTIVPYPMYVLVAERLNMIAYGDTPKKTVFSNTGAEAIENAVRVARYYTKRPALIAFEASFHGRSFLTITLTGKTAYRTGQGPTAPSVYHVPFPNAMRGGSTERSIKAIKDLFKYCVEVSQVAAIVIEPVQGEGGFNVAPVDFMQQLRALCDENGIMLIFDEVQCGFGRTGKFFAAEHYGVEPDLTAIAKSMSGGFPISACIGKAEIMDSLPPGGFGSTYQGNPLGLAASNAVLDVMEEEKLCERSMVLGERFKARMESVRGSVPNLRDIRGLGSMVALEFMKPGTETPDAEFTKKVQSLSLDNGLILLICGADNNVIRFLYPLTIEDSVFDEGLAILEKAMRSASS